MNNAEIWKYSVYLLPSAVTQIA